MANTNQEVCIMEDTCEGLGLCKLVGKAAIRYHYKNFKNGAWETLMTSNVRNMEMRNKCCNMTGKRKKYLALWA